MNKKLRKKLFKIIISAFVFGAAILLPLPQYPTLALFLAAYLITGGEILGKAFRGIIRGQVFDENFLMTIATLGAVILGEYSEAVAVMLFFQIGEFFQSYAVNQSRKSIASLMDIRPDSARVFKENEWREVSPQDVKTGETIMVLPGEKIPLDAIVTKGCSSIDTAALTGESLPRDVAEGDEIISGCINLSGVLEAKVRSEFSQSAVAKILDLVENASAKKAKMENFITRFARYYTPAVVIIAALLAALPPLLFTDATFADWGYRAITFLVISCPCALVISVPLSFFGGLGAASKCGILIKGSNYLEVLSQIGCIVFDKTGTLTKGTFEVKSVRPEKMSPQELLRLAAAAETFSAHPIALSIKKAYGEDIPAAQVTNIRELHGLGLKAEYDGRQIAAGNLKLMKQLGLCIPEIKETGTVIYIAVDNRYAGGIVIADRLKENTSATITSLRQNGIKRTAILSGDNNTVVCEIAQKAGIDTCFGELLPTDKILKLEQLQQEVPFGQKLLFVGDGINDAPVLARADIGVAMGGIGSDAAIEAADIVIMNDDLTKLVSAIKISRKTLLIVKENIVFAIGVKLLVLALGAAGLASIWAAVFADVGVSVIAILNAVRILGFHKKC